VQLEALNEELSALRSRFPDVVIDRYLEHVPSIASDVHIARGVALAGRVRLHRGVSIWYGCVLRGDVNAIEIGENSNIQDGTVVHLGDDDPTFVAEEVVVGHRAVLHGCHIEAGCLIGIQSTILDGVRIGHGSVVGAGAVVTAGTQVPPHSLVLGVPGKVVKTLSASDVQFHRKLAGKYLRMSHNYRRG
jgi:carbonic anhydrase/acetyltransferase-like protein (isoleucine patch superfamily)